MVLEISRKRTFLPFLGLVFLAGTAVLAQEEAASERTTWHRALQTRQKHIQPKDLQLLGLQISKLPRDTFGQGIPPVGPQFVRSWIVGSGTGLYGSFKLPAPMRLVFQEDVSSLEQFADDRGRDLSGERVRLVAERSGGGSGRFASDLVRRMAADQRSGTDHDHAGNLARNSAAAGPTSSFRRHGDVGEARRGEHRTDLGWQNVAVEAIARHGSTLGRAAMGP